MTFDTLHKNPWRIGAGLRIMLRCELPRTLLLRSSNAGSWIRPRNTPAQGSKTARGGRYYPRLDAYAALWMLSRPLLLPPLVYPHPASGLHQRGLYRSVCILQAVPEPSLLGAYEPVSRGALQGGDLPGHAREVAGYVPANVIRLLRSHLRSPNPPPGTRPVGPDRTLPGAGLSTRPALACSSPSLRSAE